MLIPKSPQRSKRNQNYFSLNYFRFVKKLLGVAASDESQVEGGDDSAQQVAEQIRAENRQLKYEIFQMQDEVLTLEK